MATKLQDRPRVMRAPRPPVRPIVHRVSSEGWPRARSTRPSFAVPVALMCFVLLVSTTLIYGIIARSPDTHSNLWNGVRPGYVRTNANYVASAPGPSMGKIALVYPPATPPPQQVAPGTGPSPTPASPTPSPSPSPTPTTTPIPSGPPVSFAGDVLPILKANCSICHGTGLAMSGISFASYQTITDTTAHPAVFVPGQPDQSLIMDVLLKRAGVQMPPVGPLPPDKIQIIQDWIAQGAKNN